MGDDVAEIRRRVGFLSELAILGAAAIVAYLVYRACAYRLLLSIPLAVGCGVAGLVVASFLLSRLRDARGFNANAAAMLIAMMAAAGGVGWWFWHHWRTLLDHVGLIAALAVVLAALFGLIVRLSGRAT